MLQVCNADSTGKKKFMSAGRLLVVSGKSNPFQLAVLLQKDQRSKELAWFVLGLTGKEKEFEYKVVTCKDIYSILTKTVNVNALQVWRENGKKDGEATQECVECLLSLEYKNSIQLLSLEHINPFKDLKLNSMGFVDELDRMNTKIASLQSFNCVNCESLSDHYSLMYQKIVCEEEIAKFTVRKQDLMLMPEYNSRIQVLKCLEYIRDDEMLNLKGKVASLMSEHELVITEMLFHNVLGDLPAEEIAALLSAFVFQAKTEIQQEISENLQEVWFDVFYS
jgi:antiviral helicase SKI2